MAAGPGRPRKNEDTEEQDLSGILKSLTPDGGWIVKIYRSKGGGMSEYLSKWEPSQVSEEAIGGKWGPGRYLIRPWSDALNKWAPAKTLILSKEVCEESGYTEEGGGMSMMEYSGYRRDEVSSKDLLAILQNSSDRQMQSFQTMMTSLTTVLAAAMSGRQQVDPIALAQLFQGKNGTAESLATMRELFGIAKELAPNNASSGDPFESLLLEAGKTILPKMFERREPRQIPAVPPSASENPLSAASVPLAAAPEQLEIQTEISEQLAFLNKLKTKALKDAVLEDVEFWAEYIVVNDDEPGPARILFLVKKFSVDQILAGLEQQDVEFKTNMHLREWFTKLHVELTEEDKNDDDGKTIG